MLAFIVDALAVVDFALARHKRCRLMRYSIILRDLVQNLVLQLLRARYITVLWYDVLTQN